MNFSITIDIYDIKIMSQQVSSPNIALSQELTRMKVRYLCCEQGGLHDGEQLNFICLDPKCRTKGLICPVCRETTHQNHQTLHLKLFLSEIHQKIYQSEEPAQAGGLTSHLAALNESRKEFISGLKEIAKQIASSFKDIEQNIEASYTKVRKMVLGQV